MTSKVDSFSLNAVYPDGAQPASRVVELTSLRNWRARSSMLFLRFIGLCILLPPVVAVVSFYPLMMLLSQLNAWFWHLPEEGFGIAFAIYTPFVTAAVTFLAGLVYLVDKSR